MLAVEIHGPVTSYIHTYIHQKQSQTKQQQNKNKNKNKKLKKSAKDTQTLFTMSQSAAPTAKPRHHHPSFEAQQREMYLPVDPDAIIDAAIDAGGALESREVATFLDSESSGLPPSLRSEFLFPSTPESATVRRPGSECIYLCGNSLGLQCTGVRKLLDEELQKWHEFGVEGHFEGTRPWVTVDEVCVDSMAKIVGANPVEVCLMNTLSANLHSMMASFYRPEPESAGKPRRYKILAEAKSFPSDKFVFESQIRLHGLDPADALIELSPREGETTLRTEDILAALEQEGPTIALCLFSGVQYYTGQLFEIGAITAAAKAQVSA